MPNSEVFEAHLREHDAQMRKVAWRILGDRHMVDDALQDSYVKAFRSWETFRADGSFAAWLRRIVVNTCVDVVRKERRRREASIETVPQEPSVADNTERISEAHRLHQAILRLPDNFRLALILVDWEGYSYREVAVLTSVSEKTVASRLNRARTSLRRQMEVT